MIIPILITNVTSIFFFRKTFGINVKVTINDCLQKKKKNVNVVKLIKILYS